MRLFAFAVLAACASATFAQEAGPRPPGSAWVVIPVQEYTALRAKAFPVTPTIEPPATVALTRVDYDLKVDGRLATGRATLTVDVLKDGGAWVRVPIPAGLLLRDARLDGNRIAIKEDPPNSSQFVAVLSKKGRNSLALDVALNLDVNQGAEILRLPTGGAALTKASVTVAAARDADLIVEGNGFLAEKSDTHWTAYSRSGEPISLVWRHRIIEPQKRVELPLRMRGTLTQLYGLGEDSTSLTAEVEFEILQGSATQVRIAVPDNVTINQVPGAMVADWDVKSGELIVNFLEPLERNARFAIYGETRLPRDGAIPIPLLRLLNTERDLGGVAVEVLGAGEVKQSTPQGLDPVDAAELGAMVVARQSPSLAAFRHRAGTVSTARSLQIQVARYTQQAVLTANIEESRYRALLTVDGKTLVQARYAVRNNQRTFIRVTLPEGAAVWSASVANRPVRPGKSPDGSLLLPLEKSRAGEDAPVFLIEILYLTRGPGWSGLRGRATLPLPVVDLPISKSGIIVYHPPQFRVSTESGAFRAQPYERPSDDIWSRASATTSETALLTPSYRAVTPQSNATQALVDNFRARPDTRRTAPMLPIRVTFPAVGPSLYLVSELTGEGKAATIELTYQKEKKGGSK